MAQRVHADRRLWLSCHPALGRLDDAAGGDGGAPFSEWALAQQMLRPTQSSTRATSNRASIREAVAGVTGGLSRSPRLGR
jgi:hypothetical protein